MATVAHLFAPASGDTANTTSYTTASFTPTAGDLLVVFVSASATLATGTMTASANGITLTKVLSSVWATTANTLYCFIANQLVPGSPSSMTVTFDCTGDAATGANISVEAVSGMTAVGTAAVRQSAKVDNSSGVPPTVTFAGACLTTNPTLGAGAKDSNPAAITEPSGWTELVDIGYATPGTGLETVARNSGHTTSAITWGASYTGCALAIELDASSGTSAPAETTTGTGAAQAPTASVAPNAEQPSGAGVAQAPTPSLGASAESPTASAAAFDATVSTATATNAPAETTTGSGAANDAAASVAPNAETTSAAGTALDASMALTANAGTTTAAVAAFDATVSTVTATDAPAETTTATASALDATVSIGGNAETTTGSGTALDATPALIAAVEAAFATGTAYDATCTTGAAGVPGRMRLTDTRPGMTLTATKPGATVTDGPTGHMTLGAL